MFVADNTLLLLPRGTPWPSGLTAGGRVLTPFNARAYVRVAHTDEPFDVDERVPAVCMVNPTYEQLLRTCVFLRRRRWGGELRLLLERRRDAQPFCG